MTTVRPVFTPFNPYKNFKQYGKRVHSSNNSVNLVWYPAIFSNEIKIKLNMFHEEQFKNNQT